MKKHFFITMFVVLLVNVFLFIAEADWHPVAETNIKWNLYSGGYNLAFAGESLYYLGDKIVNGRKSGNPHLMAWDTDQPGSKPYPVREVPSTSALIAIADDNRHRIAVASYNRIDMYFTGYRQNRTPDQELQGLYQSSIRMTAGKDQIDAIAFYGGGDFFIAAKSSDSNNKAILRGWLGYDGWEREVDLSFSNYDVSALAATAAPARSQSDWYFFRDRDDAVLEYRFSTGKKTYTYSHGSSDVTALAYEDGYIASGHANGDVEIWDFDPKGHVRTLGGASDRIFSLDFTQDHRYLAAAARDGVYVWHVSSGKLVYSVFSSRTEFFDVAFSPNGTLAIRTFSRVLIHKRGQAETALNISKRKLDSATLIDGLKIQKNRMYDVELPDLSFGYSGDNEFLLLSQGAFNTCGTASVEMILHYYGKKATQSQIWKAGGIHNVANLGGTWPMEAEQALDELGVPSTWYNRGTLDNLKHHVRHNRPPMIILRFQAGMHYVVVVGYNSGNDFLVADPNGFFRWISGSDLLKGWSLKEPGLPGNYRAVNIANWFQNRAAELIDENNYIVPDNPPQYHFRPNWSELKYAHVVGPNKANWGWFATTEWERTLEFHANFDHYVWSRVEPSSVLNPGGIRVSAVDGHRRNGQRIKFWGKVTHGKAQRGELYLFVRSYRHPRSTVAAAPSLDLTVDSIESLPARSELFSNYPNPFNPETWIPYQLAESTEVTVDIYAADGQLVRTLSLGHQAAGVYRSRSRAAYWDGRNDVGEYVASGIYFYALKAGEFAATRKMLIVK